MECIDILMATYNGAENIKTQIYSLLSQNYKLWKLIIHDDKSSDNTVEIVKDFMQIDKRIVLIEDGIVCRSASKNFLHLLKYSTSEYVMFCDQDDIWFDNKISVMFEAIKNRDKTIPTIIFSQSYVWLPNKGIIGKTIAYFPHKLRDFLFANGGVIGCSSMFNKEAKELLMEWGTDCSMHDYILQLIGVALGKIVYVDLPLMLYRQHDKSVTPTFRVDRDNVRKLKDWNIPVVKDEVYRDIAYFSDKYKEKIQIEDHKLIDIYLKLLYKNIIIKLYYVIKYGFNLRGSTLKLILKIIVRVYKK